MKPEEHIKSLNDNTSKAKSLFGTSEPVLDKDKLAQFELSYILAKHLKAYSDGENIILPALIKATEILFGSVKAKRVKKIKLSNDTVQRRTVEMANAISDQIKINVQTGLFGFFSIQLDETTDIENNSQMAVFIRWADNSGIKEDILCMEN